MQAPSASELLEQFLPSVENLPSEIKHLCSELISLSTELHTLEAKTTSTDNNLKKIIKAMPTGQIGTRDTSAAAAPEGIADPVAENKSEIANAQQDDENNDAMDVDTENSKPDNNEEEEKPGHGSLPELQAQALSMIKDDTNQVALYDTIHSNHNIMLEMQDRRISMIEKARELLDKHISRLEVELEKLDEGDPGTSSVSNNLSSSVSIVSTPSVASFDALKKANRTNWETPTIPLASTAAPVTIKKVVQPSPVIKMTIPVRKKHQKRKLETNVTGGEVIDERLYCTCQQISYGEMIACDNSVCPYEWFHLECAELSDTPKGVWYCEFCKTSNVS